MSWISVKPNYRQLEAWPCLVIFLCLISLKGLAQERYWQGQMFWREKPAVMEKMVTERSIPVSVTVQNEKEKRIWWMKGAGIVAAPLEFVVQEAGELSVLKEYDHLLGEVVWDKDTDLLTLQPQFLPIKTKWKIKFFRETYGEERALRYEVVSGWLVGSRGIIIFRGAAKNTTEVGLIAQAERDGSRFSLSLISVAVEGAMFHIAKSLRITLENKWKTKESGRVN